MPGVITTGVTNQAKMDLFGGGLMIVASNSQTGNTFASPNTLINQLTNTFPLWVGMTVTHTHQNAGNTEFITRIINSTAVEVSEPPTGASQESITFAGDQVWIALIKFSPTNNYNSTNTSCYANLVVASDEGSGTGYAAGGVQLTVAANPDIPDSNTAIVNFSPNPSWTTATLDVAGCMLYTKGQNSGRTGANNSSSVLAGIGTNTAFHAISVHDFGGEQKVTAGTLTVNMPTANGSAAILRIA